MTTNELRAPGRVATLSRGIVWAIFGIAALVLGGTLVLSIWGVVESLSSGTIAITLSTAQSLPAEADLGPAALLSGQFDSASVVVGGLDAGTFAIALISKIALALTQLAIAASVALLSWSLVKARPFRRSLSVTVTLSGAIVLIGGILAAGLGVLSSWMVADQLNDPDAGLDGFWPILAGVDPTFIAIGVALLLAGLAFEYGDKLQRDTEGLV